MAGEKTEQLWSIHEIRQLAYRYAYAIDTRDYDLMKSLWVNTAPPVGHPTLDYHRMGEMFPIYIEKSKGHASVLLVGNHLITLDGPDKAHGQVYCQASVDSSIGFWDQMILYKDVYERHNGEWLFLTRDHLLWWGEVRSSNPMSQSPANWPASEIGAGDAFDLIRRA
jgi:hypothetical protein